MTTIDSDPDECRHGVWPASSCSYCSGKDAARARAAAVIEHEFPARYISLLGCGHFSTIGETIGRRADGTLVCAECGDQRGR